MSRVFWAENRETGERWKPNDSGYYKEFLVLYDSGYLAIVTDFGSYDGMSIGPLDTKIWKLVYRNEDRS